MVNKELEDIHLIRVTTISNSLGRLLRGQLKYMTAFMRVTAVCAPSDRISTIEAREGISVKPIDMKRKISVFADVISIVRMILYLRKEKPDIIHSHTPKAGLVSMIAGYFASVPIRMHTVAGMPLEIQTGLYRRILMLAEKLTYKFATAVYPNSFGLHRFILENKLCSPSKLKVIGSGSSNGIDLDHFDRAQVSDVKMDALRQELTLNPNDKIFLFVGRLVPDKGIDELVTAWQLLSERNEGIKLLLVGREEVLYPLKQRTKEVIYADDTIIACGYQSDVRPYFAIADLFVFPSYREGLPNVLLQAGAFSLASIATDINGNTDIIKQDVNGILISPCASDSLLHAMQKLLDDDRLLAALSKNARKVIEENYNQKVLWSHLKNEYYRQIEIQTL